MKDIAKKIFDSEVSRRFFIKTMAAIGVSVSSPGLLAKGVATVKTYGWTGGLLRVELGSGKTASFKITDYEDAFVGGRALGARIYYDDVSPSVGALEPDNELIVTSGPLGGTNAFGCSRWVITAKSPYLYPDQYAFGNGGGYLGAAVKHAGYDGIAIRGKAKTPSYLLVDNNKAELKDAKGLWGLTSGETMKKLRIAHGEDARIVCIGPAGEKLVRFAIAFTDLGGGLSNGMGAVMGSKNIKAIIVKGNNQVPVAYPEKLNEINNTVLSLRKGLSGSFFKSEIMINGVKKLNMSPCYGCPDGCARATFQHTSGEIGTRKNCGSSYFYLPWDMKYNKGKQTEIPFLATQLCNQYGICTQEVANIIDWLNRCFEKGVLSEEKTGLPLSKIGSYEFIQKLTSAIADRKGFGDILAEGTRRASIANGKEAEEIALSHINKIGYMNNSYGARVFLITALFYATETRSPIIQLHEVNYVLLKWAMWHLSKGIVSPINTEDLRKIAARAWGGEKAVDFSTYDGKAKAAFMVQNRQHAKETMVGCDWVYPIIGTDQTKDHIGEPALPSQLFQAVTGREMDENAFLRLGERSVNLQRAIHGREGKAGRKDDVIDELNFTEPVDTMDGTFGMFNPDYILPGKGDEIISRKGKKLDRAGFEQMKDEYYELRRWDVKTGLQTKKRLKELGMESFCKDLEKRGLLKV